MSEEPRTLYVVLARGGSKRLPDKNLRCVGGVPLVGRAVRTIRQAARRLGDPARIVVSTDDPRIAEVAREYGAETPFVRPAELATDSASSVDALRHAVRWFGDRGETFTEVVLVQPTAPLCAAQDAVGAIRAFRQAGGVSVVTVRPAAHSGPGLSYALVGDRLIEGTPPVAADAHVELNGAVYVCSPRWLVEHDRLCVSGLSRGVLMPAERSVDVDTAIDLAVAQALWEQSLLWPPGKCLVIAEAGVNHNGCVDTAFRLIDAGQQAGADAVKFQTFSAARLVTRGAPKAAYQKAFGAPNESQLDMLARLELSPEDHHRLIEHCRQRQVVFLSSAFGEEDVDLLDGLDVPAIKIGSGEITNHPLLAHAGETLRPVILSTGASWLHEVAEAVAVLRRAGCCELALLHCVSHYPAAPVDVNLRAMETLASAFGVPVGFSDHTLGIEVAVAAVARGARILEKHFTLDRGLPGPDHRASLEPAEFAALVRAIRNVEAALGDGTKRPAASEAETVAVARRGLVAAEDLPAGTVLRRHHLASRRPATGICPSQLDRVVGMRLTRALRADEPLTWAHLRAEGGPT